MVKIKFNSIYKNWGEIVDPYSNFKLFEIVKDKPPGPVKFSELDEVISEKCSKKHISGSGTFSEFDKKVGELLGENDLEKNYK